MAQSSQAVFASCTKILMIRKIMIKRQVISNFQTLMNFLKQWQAISQKRKKNIKIFNSILKDKTQAVFFVLLLLILDNSKTLIEIKPTRIIPYINKQINKYTSTIFSLLLEFKLKQMSFFKFQGSSCKRKNKLSINQQKINCAHL
ncbi:hypothetical protein TTHERM_00079460 (macronuclear) [Tetrahymena thermophila SB210]|uniref:Uncharacterized protein n=1 Tax=Tetrahymena thermophila (strain SB210) TaxID=312017 RepID=Q23FR8_TETTS|nr:hypothetical protein TTHERM_00079460 [Tetrahymena thermophila SB210]EAR95542.2 hypothetical protein TTHERM_00079460 [Tetrahymena thermophila SB210]|eukprot:XP_001015787.2 hypothetical protein TTHERM_00079460 [Tetrahymena thermophila SB210]